VLLVLFILVTVSGVVREMSSSWEPYSSSVPSSTSSPSIHVTSGLGGPHSNGPSTLLHDVPRGAINSVPSSSSDHSLVQSQGPSPVYPPPPPYLHQNHAFIGGHGAPPVGSVYPPTVTTTPVIHPYPPPISVGNHLPYNHHHHIPPHHHGQPPPRPLHQITPSHPGVSNYPPNPYGPPPHHGSQPLPGQPPLSPTQVTAASPNPSGHHQIPGHHLPGHHPYGLKSPPGTSPNPAAGPLTPGPVPQTPLGPPSGGNPFSAVSPELDLHPELVNIGWRKFWSKRESRWYFWNCNTGESLWEVPPIPGRHPPGPIHSGVFHIYTYIYVHFS